MALTSRLHCLDLLPRVFGIVSGHRLQLLILTLFLFGLVLNLFVNNGNSAPIKCNQPRKSLKDTIAEYRVFLFPLEKGVDWVFQHRQVLQLFELVCPLVNELVKVGEIIFIG